MTENNSNISTIEGILTYKGMDLFVINEQESIPISMSSLLKHFDTSEDFARIIGKKVRITIEVL